MKLEDVLCSRDGFGLESATFLQRCRARIKDGAPLADLLARSSDFDRRCLETAIGCDPSALPVGSPPVEVCDLDPVRTGKSLENAALGTCRAQTIDPSSVKPGEEPPRISILATSTDNADAVRGHLNMINERPKLRALKIGEDADSVTLRHPAGFPVQIRVVAAHRGGYSLASRWSGSVIFDEAPGWYSTDRVVSLEESREQALGRLLGGAQCIYSGSKWQPSGFCYDAWSNHFGKPTSEMVVFSPQVVDGVAPARQLNPHYWTEERIERLKRTSPRTFTMHVQNEWGAAGNSAFDVDELAAVTHATLPEGTLFGSGFCAIDASALRHDSFAAIFAAYAYPSRERIVKKYAHPTIPGGYWQPTNPGPDDFVEQLTGPVLRVHDVMAFRPPGFTTLDVVAAVAAKCRRYGVKVVFGDQFESGSLAGLFSQHRIGLRTWHWTRELKDEAIAGTLRRMVREKRISLTPHDLLRRHLLSIREIPSAGGTWKYPTSGLDTASALITLAMALSDPEVLGVNIDAHARIFDSPTAPRRNYRVELPGR